MASRPSTWYTQGRFGQLVVLKGTQISSIPMAEAIAKTRTVTEDYFDVIKGLQPKKAS